MLIVIVLIALIALIALISCFLIWQLSKHKAKHTKYDVGRICRAFGMFRIIGGKDAVENP